MGTNMPADIFFTYVMTGFISCILLIIGFGLFLANKQGQPKH